MSSAKLTWSDFAVKGWPKSASNQAKEVMSLDVANNEPMLLALHTPDPGPTIVHEYDIANQLYYFAMKHDGEMLHIKIAAQVINDAAMNGVGALQLAKEQFDIIIAGKKANAKAKAEITFLYTDGGFQAKTGVGGYAWAAYRNNEKFEEYAGAVTSTTNNRMELTAVISALNRLEIGPPIILRADSQYVLKGMESWIDKWRGNGWVNYNKEPVKNRDLWEQLGELRDLHSLAYEHVKGHSGNEYNEYVDKLCTEVMAWLIGHNEDLPGGAKW
jgi:ribonuclease HI